MYNSQVADIPKCLPSYAFLDPDPGDMSASVAGDAASPMLPRGVGLYKAGPKPKTSLCPPPTAFGREPAVDSLRVSCGTKTAAREKARLKKTQSFDSCMAIMYLWCLPGFSMMMMIHSNEDPADQIAGLHRRCRTSKPGGHVILRDRPRPGPT